MSEQYMADEGEDDDSEVSDENNLEDDHEDTEYCPLLDDLDVDDLTSLNNLTRIPTASMAQMRAGSEVGDSRPSWIKCCDFMKDWSEDRRELPVQDELVKQEVFKRKKDMRSACLVKNYIVAKVKLVNFFGNENIPDSIKTLLNEDKHVVQE